MTYPGGGGQGGWNEQSGWGQQGDHPGGGYSTGDNPAGYYTPDHHPPGDHGGQFPQTGGFPQQGYGQYGGLGVYSGGDEPPKKNNTKVWLVVGIVALVLLGGGGLTAFLLTRDPGTTASPGPSSTAPNTPQQTGKACPRTDDKACVQTSIGLSYEVPKTWIEVNDKVGIEKYPNSPLSSVTTYGDYTCEGKGYTKGTNGATLLDKGDIKTVATEFTKAVATQFYASGGTPTVTLNEPKAVKLQHKQEDGKDVVIEGFQVDATVTTTGNKCLASKGMVKAVVLSGSSKLHALVVNGDLEGGEGDKPVPKESELQAMIDSLRPTT